MPPKVIGPKRAISIEIILFLAYAFFSASWMVGSIVTTDMAQEFGVNTIPSSVNNAISAAKILGNFVAAWIPGEAGAQVDGVPVLPAHLRSDRRGFLHLLPHVHSHPVPALGFGGRC